LADCEMGLERDNTNVRWQTGKLEQTAYRWYGTESKDKPKTSN